jgi:predicted polyphosphate/ATP-dependent NAD kinase
MDNISQNVSISDSAKNEKNYIPLILIVVNGGKNTLTTVIESLDNKVPVLILGVIAFGL